MFQQGNPVSERVAAYVRETLPGGLVMDVTIPRTQAASEAFGASQPLVLRSPDDAASKAYADLAARLSTRLQ